MAIFKALEFDGVNSLDYGIYITGEAVYNAPERAVEMINIPGKNGALALDQGRFENIEVTYHAGCFADSQADFAYKVMRFRNALASRYTYKRLTDEYHPDEYRLGLYKSGLDVDAVRYGTAGKFNIVFDCKPQRFLIDGDRAISPTEWSDLQTESGELVTIESDGSLAVKSLEVSLEPIQAGSGEPSPSNVRAISGHTEVNTHRTGKNLLPNTATSGTVANVTYTVNDDGTITANGTSSGWQALTIGTASLKEGTYLLSSGIVDSATYLETSINGTTYNTNGVAKKQFVLSEPTSVTVKLFARPNTTRTDLLLSPMIRLASETDATYEPYNGQVYTTALGRTVYGGTLDVVSGVLTVDRAILTLNGSETWIASNGTATACMRVQTRTNVGFKPNTSNASLVGDISSAFVEVTPNQTWDGTIGFSVSTDANPYLHFCQTGQKNMSVEAWKTYLASNPIQVVYKLATPQTYQLTPQQVELLVGENHLWSDGEITVEYGVHPYYNPTPFESKPLIKVTGTGTLGIGEYIMTITGTASQTLYIDCETMEIYTLEGTVPTGASSLVSINKNDFPVLEPGTNYISVGSGITAVTITPRWWRI